MNKIKRYSVFLLAAAGLLATGCSKEKSEAAVPEGMVQVNFCQEGSFGAPFSDLKTAKEAVPTETAPSLRYVFVIPYNLLEYWRVTHRLQASLAISNTSIPVKRFAITVKITVSHVSS